MRILHTPANIGNQAATLSQSQKKILERDGKQFRITSACFASSDYANENVDILKNPPEKIAKINALRRLYISAQIAMFGFKSFLAYDVFQFYFGRSFINCGGFFPKLSLIDLPLLKIFGKKIFMMLQGCDVRLRTLNENKAVHSCRQDECANAWCNYRESSRKKILSKKISRYCDRVFCLNPDLVPLVEGSEFIPYAPLSQKQLDILPKHRVKENGSAFRIVHAPSDRSIKGTRYLQAAVSELKKKHSVELVLVENLSRDEALNVYASADVIVDQLLLGWYGAVSVEAMAMGVPVVSNVQSEHLKYVPPEMLRELPLENAFPSTVKDVLEKLIKDPVRRDQMSRKGIEYVSRWHDPLKIAGCLLRVYQDPALSFWAAFNSCE